MQLQLEIIKMKNISDYETIPNNDRMLFDLKLTGLTYELEREILCSGSWDKPIGK